MQHLVELESDVCDNIRTRKVFDNAASYSDYVASAYLNRSLMFALKDYY